jgi:methylated-DNA-protein-cysteine methyltransferase-like protein
MLHVVVLGFFTFEFYICRMKDKFSFFEDVYAVVRLIPRGRVTSYGAIAKYLGTAKSARMVGWAMNACHEVLPPVPAHRVVNRQGLLSGKNHFHEVNEMENRLKQEGVNVIADQIQDFYLFFWDPTVELAME